MSCVIIESPYAGDIAGNTEYARRCVADAMSRGEFPFASHLFYTQPGILDENISTERELGIQAGWAWMKKADKVVVYTDRGISHGMSRGMLMAASLGLPVEYRSLTEVHDART